MIVIATRTSRAPPAPGPMPGTATCPLLVGTNTSGPRSPTSSGQVAVPGIGPGAGGAREVRVAITINAGSGGAPEAMARSSRQVARAVRDALTEAG
ncbi:hypothetical protein [Sphingomonas endophytica]|uniref:hypothetical protein n=1 Tax=Sphingomonas endophytica TaxID=869719 RepID=UPI00073789B1